MNDLNTILKFLFGSFFGIVIVLIAVYYFLLRD